MIEELTPQVMMVLMLLIIVSSTILTATLSLLLLSRYRRSVMRLMMSQGRYGAQLAETSIPVGMPAAAIGGGEALYRRAVTAPRRSAVTLLFPVLLFALVLALAALVVYPSGLGLPGFLIAVWVYLWPGVLALQLVLPGAFKQRIIPPFLYFIGFVLLGVLAATTVTNLPEYHFGGFHLSARSTVTPWGMVRLWLLVNAAPTILVWLCFNHRIRAVAPMMLALSTTLVSGLLALWLAIFSMQGVDLFVALSAALDLHVDCLLSVALLSALLVFRALGCVLIRAIAQLYQRGGASDRSLQLDALLLLFANSYGMWLVSGGVLWYAVVPGAFLAYRLSLAWMTHRLMRGPTAPQGLTFLRVFALGQRSEALLNEIAGYWRYLGSLQVITGPDLARSTLQPHQFLDFLGGRLESHFVQDSASLHRSLAQRKHHPDPDGRYRINNFFCRDDSWQAVLTQLVQAGDIVLMDLRSFTAANAGCIAELRLLVGTVPFDRCLLLVDASTDQDFLRSTLKESWEQLPPDAVNHHTPLDELGTFDCKYGEVPVQPLIARLCQAVSG